MMTNPWKKQKGSVIFTNPWITLEEDEVINPGGGISQYGRVHFKNFAIGIIPLDQHQNTWLVGQWRYPLNEYSWEIPMGGGPVSGEVLDSARRELKEETGLLAEKWTRFLKIHTSNSVTDEVGYAFLAEELTQSEPDFEETEQLEIRKLPFKQVVDMCMTGQITDSLSMVAIFKLARSLNL